MKRLSAKPKKQKLAKFGYGIVDRYGEPWWDDTCVCEDRLPLDDQVRALNDPSWRPDDGYPFRVVALYWRVTR